MEVEKHLNFQSLRTNNLRVIGVYSTLFDWMTRSLSSYLCGEQYFCSMQSTAQKYGRAFQVISTSCTSYDWPIHIKEMSEEKVHWLQRQKSGTHGAIYFPSTHERKQSWTYTVSKIYIIHYATVVYLFFRYIMHTYIHTLRLVVQCYFMKFVAHNIS